MNRTLILRLIGTTASIALASTLGAGCASAPPGSTAEGSGTTSAAPNATTAALSAASKTASAPSTTPAPGSATPASSPSAANGASGAGGPAAPGQPKPFAEVIKDATETPGLFRVWQKDDKVWLEITPEQFGQPFFFTINLSRGIGQYNVYGGMMLDSQVAYFKRIGNQVQLLAKNDQYTAAASLPIAIAVREGFSESLLAASTVVSQPHAERKSVLVDANALLLADLAGGARFTSPVLQRGYTFDAKNSSFERVRNTPAQSSFVVSAHYANPKATLPPPPTPNPTPNPFPPFKTLPDARSLFLGFHYNFAQLPEPMPARRADPRVGHFATEIWNFSNDLNYTAKTFQVNRWRLEKKDPAATLSEPVAPIVYWIDRNVPESYRTAVRDGILDWNKAFERIGYKDAIVVRQQGVDADFDTADARHASVRWYVATDAGFAIGPSQVDPRTGEILDADAAIPEAWSRIHRDVVSQQVPPPVTTLDLPAHRHAIASDACTYADEALAETQFALDLLVARGEQVERELRFGQRFVQAALKAVVIHEIGHTLGLRHNFRASTVFSLEQVSNPAFTRERGISGSVMDYTPINIALSGQPQPDFFERTIGPYDYWAIEYAYRPLPAATEAADLEAIAARGGSDPLLAFSSDEESHAAIDPEASQFDLGSDPLAYLSKRIALSRELWDRLQARRLEPGQNYATLRRDFEAGFRQVTRATPLIAKYVGGVGYVRDYGGTGRLPLTPVPAGRQRAALKLLADAILSDQSFRLKPDFLRAMGIDYLQVGFDQGQMNPDFSLRTRVLNLQKDLLNRLFADEVAARILDSEAKMPDPREAFRLSELFDTVQAAIWSELAQGGSIGAMRRDLQREHLRRIVTVLTRPPATTPADVTALQRENARALRKQLQTALGRGNLDKETRAHLADAAGTLDEALKAPMTRQGG